MEQINKMQTDDMDGFAEKYAEQFAGPEQDFAIEDFKAGWLACKEQMMKEAVEAEVENASFGILYLRKNLGADGYLTGDKVKLIIIKED